MERPQEADPVVENWDPGWGVCVGLEAKKRRDQTVPKEKGKLDKTVA